VTPSIVGKGEEVAPPRDAKSPVDPVVAGVLLVAVIVPALLLKVVESGASVNQVRAPVAAQVPVVPATDQVDNDPTNLLEKTP